MEVEVQNEGMDEENGRVEILIREVGVQDKKIEVHNQDLGVHVEKVSMQTKEAKKIKVSAQKEEMNERKQEAARVEEANNQCIGVTTRRLIYPQSLRIPT